MLLSCRDVAEGRYITAVPEISCESDGTHALFFLGWLEFTSTLPGVFMNTLS
jgi:hypothetical protein